MNRFLGSTVIVGVVVVSLAPRLSIAPSERSANSPHPLVVHEWGTLTVRHTANGTAEGRLNRLNNYDPLPAFVHQFEPSGPVRRAPLIKSLVTDGDPQVTMRLETPVIYFHPRAGDSIPPFDVSVDFRGGVLNEFYPNAQPSVNGWNGVRLSESVTSTLTWRGVALRERAELPGTTAPVWLAPRDVHSSPLTIGGESEQYIFYRGMASLDAILRTEIAGGEVRVRGPRSEPWFASETEPLGQLWLIDVRPGGMVAFRSTDSLNLRRGDTTVLARFADFSNADYSREGLYRLRASMERALVGRGLYEDEARAMLETWKRSYFTETGLRLFYIAPSDWVNYHLPLRISAPNTLTRVLIGRIDLPATLSP